MHAYFYKNKIIPKSVKWRKKLIRNIPPLENISCIYLNNIMFIIMCVLEFLKTEKVQKAPIMFKNLSIWRYN